LRVDAAIDANAETVDAIEAADERTLDAVMDRHLRLLEDAWAAASDA
jgi:hypothetical protein